MRDGLFIFVRGIRILKNDFPASTDIGGVLSEIPLASLGISLTARIHPNGER